MGKGVAVSKDQLRIHLKEQLGFLVRSSSAYDSGYRDEAKRIAVVLRVLFHDTANSKSLLGQLGIKQNIAILDTCAPFHSGNLLSYSGLTMMKLTTGQGGEYVPLLDEGPRSTRHKKIFFEKWWNTIVIVDQKKNSFKRRELVLAVANKDGGVHIDPTLDEAYVALTKENSMGWVFSDGVNTGPVLPIELASIRQIGHEVISTFKQKMPDMIS